MRQTKAEMQEELLEDEEIIRELVQENVRQKETILALADKLEHTKAVMEDIQRTYQEIRADLIRGLPNQVAGRSGRSNQ